MSSLIPRPLFEEILKGRASLFLGAGASCEAKFPDSKELSQYLISEAGEPYSSKLKDQDLSVVAEFLYAESSYGRSWVRNKIIQLIQRKHKDVNRPPSRAHEMMTLIAWRSIFTTNYDRLVEISYDFSSNSVQRVLPIYEPDEQIMRHERDNIKLIKLNGSVDEAERRSSHELVVTFSDQQKARSRNKEFYELLKEEAINGPLIFVGFRFQHPGTITMGTAPEFLLLKDLLHEMGSAFGWHYCVAPFDSSTESEFIIKTLNASQIHVINATFGEFLGALVRELRGAIKPLANRPPIVVSISNSSLCIEADEYEEDRHHFEIIGSHLESQPQRKVSESLNGYENWYSFFSKHFIERSCKQDFIDELNKGITNAPNIISFVASAGWGKTFFLRSIAADLYRERAIPILLLNPFGTLDISSGESQPIISGKWDEKRIDYIIKNINKIAEDEKLSDGQGIPIIIIDGCPERVEEVISLFRYLNDNNRKFVIVMAFRDNEYEIAVQGHALLKRGLEFRPEHNRYNSKEEVRRLIDFCEKNNVGGIENDIQKDIIAQRISESNADDSLILALQIIFDGQHRPFAEIIKGLWNGIDNEIGKNLVLRVASLHRFGSVFYPRLYSLVNTFASNQYQILEVYYKKILGKILFEDTVAEEPCVRSFHSLVALEFTRICGKSPSEIDDELLLLVGRMKDNNERDLELIRRILKHINYYEINLSSEDKINQLFKVASESTNEDWVVCHQYSNYLLHRNEFEAALTWLDRASRTNPRSATIKHTKGNILRRWGMYLELRGDPNGANGKFEEARKYFALSRIGTDPSEYGYVTHLDMLLSLIDKRDDEIEIANMTAEGAQIYKEGVKAISEDRFNLLLDKRFSIFRLENGIVEGLLEKIEKGIVEKKATVYAISFLAEYYYGKGNYDKAIKSLDCGKAFLNQGILLWLKEAEIHARESNFNEAIKSIDSAKRRVDSAENEEIAYSLIYWDLVTSFIYKNYDNANKCAIKLINTNYFPGRSFPRGYLWRIEAKGKNPSERSFKKDAILFKGRVQNVRASEGNYGRIEMNNVNGEIFYINFNKKYFPRRDIRPGQPIQFAVALLSEGLRAESVDSKPFVNTKDDLFLLK